jgi:serine/threonine-protein kinase RsbW
MDNDLLFELKVVLNELILNAIIHGNKEDKDKFVEVNAAITKSNYFLLSISDEGEGYDYNFYLKKCSENKDVLCWNDVEEKGRGIKIVKSLCDNIRFNEKGNKVFVVKSLEKHYITSE